MRGQTLNVEVALSCTGVERLQTAAAGTWGCVKAGSPGREGTDTKLAPRSSKSWADLESGSASCINTGTLGRAGKCLLDWKPGKKKPQPNNQTNKKKTHKDLEHFGKKQEQNKPCTRLVRHLLASSIQHQPLQEIHISQEATILGDFLNNMPCLGTSPQIKETNRS